MTDMIMTMESWEKDLKTYYEAGGATVSEDDKVIIAIKMLPMSVDRSSLAALRACRTYESVKQEVREMKTLFGEAMGETPGAHIMDEHPSTRDQHGEIEDDDDELEDELHANIAELDPSCHDSI